MSKERNKVVLALLTGGISSEDYLSRRSCDTFCQVLDKERYDFYLLDWKKNGEIVESELNQPTKIARTHRDIISCFTDFRGDVVVNTLHGERENCGQIQGLLELAQIPYTGNRLSPSSIGMDKEKTKLCFQSLGINTPRALSLPLSLKKIEAFLELLNQAKLRYPLICKPVRGGSSDGIFLIRDASEVATAYELICQKEPSQAYFIEEFVEGSELSVALFNLGSDYPVYTFPVSRIDYNGTFFNKQVKYEEGYQVRFPHYIKPRIEQEMKNAALQIHRYLGLEGFSRTDFILGSNGFFALEVNTHPGMSSSSIVPKMVNEEGHSLTFFLDQMIEHALTTN